MGERATPLELDGPDGAIPCILREARDDSGVAVVLPGLPEPATVWLRPLAREAGVAEAILAGWLARLQAFLQAALDGRRLRAVRP